METEILPVHTGHGYDIALGKGVLGETGTRVAALTTSRRAAVITDSNVEKLYGAAVMESLRAAGFQAELFAFPAGETSKNHATLLTIYSFLARAEITRADLIVALGGGVVGDVAGFAAATWQRGIPFVQIPTTLLAQVDSSIGGKTAVDLPEGKNLVGAFWQPSLVLCDPLTLRTLDARNVACGMGEIVKHACIRSETLFETLERGAEVTPAVIAQNLAIKRAVVEHDERERGERMVLNFGHTLGHAVEKLQHYAGATHGEAVAMGMVLMTHASERNGLTPACTADRIARLLARCGLPDRCDLPLKDIVQAAAGDKKRAGDRIRLIVLRRIGEAVIYPLPVAELPAFFGL